MNQDIFIALLKQFTQFIVYLTEEDISDIISGKKSLSIKLVDKKQSSSPKSSSIDLMEIENSLTIIDSREEAEELLKNFKKADLKTLAKKLDIPVQSNEAILKLKEKIIESTVGFKLRSKAIQSEDR